VNQVTIKRGDIFYADLSPVVGSEQGGLRPVLIIQNDVGNKYSPTVIAAAITSKLGKSKLPTHIEVFREASPGETENAGLSRDSVVLLEQIRTLDKQRLKEKMGHLDDNMMIRVDNAITISFGLSKQDVDYISKKYEGSTASGNEAIQKTEASITGTIKTHKYEEITDGHENAKLDAGHKTGVKSRPDVDVRDNIKKYENTAGWRTGEQKSKNKTVKTVVEDKEESIYAAALLNERGSGT
jgi:hypothetical protein